ncbi:MAG: hypothetical protein HYZ74_08730 [Elusimicrobia bacterium]|nr:hypothetical protein [Elusimicrobiota bacterium]
MTEQFSVCVRHRAGILCVLISVALGAAAFASAAGPAAPYVGVEAGPILLRPYANAAYRYEDNILRTPRSQKTSSLAQTYAAGVDASMTGGYTRLLGAYGFRFQHVPLRDRILKLYEHAAGVNGRRTMGERGSIGFDESFLYGSERKFSDDQRFLVYYRNVSGADFHAPVSPTLYVRGKAEWMLMRYQDSDVNQASRDEYSAEIGEGTEVGGYDRVAIVQAVKRVRYKASRSGSTELTVLAVYERYNDPIFTWKLSAGVSRRKWDSPPAGISPVRLLPRYEAGLSYTPVTGRRLGITASRRFLESLQFDYYVSDELSASGQVTSPGGAWSVSTGGLVRRNVYGRSTQIGGLSAARRDDGAEASVSGAYSGWWPLRLSATYRRHSRRSNFPSFNFDANATELSLQAAF